MPDWQQAIDAAWPLLAALLLGWGASCCPLPAAPTATPPPARPRGWCG